MNDLVRRRFALVSPNFYPRTCGVGDHSVRLGSELQRRGHEVRAFSRLPAEPNPAAPAVEIQGIAGRLPLELAHGIAAMVERYAPSEVILQYTSQMWGVWRFGSPAFVWLAGRLRRRGIRVTLIAHELYVPWRARPDLLFAAGLQRVQLGTLLKACDRFFVTTERRAAAVATLCRLVGVPAPSVIRVGANALPIARRRSGAVANAPRIGFFSTAAVGKRFDVVLDAFARIAAEIPEAELVLIGDLGPPDWPRVRQIQRAISEHPARAHIRATGKLSLDEIASEMAGLDLYLFPMEAGANTRSGTLPVALGTGLPVVAVRGIDTDDALFRDGENIALSPEMSGPAFAEKALFLLRNREAAEQIGVWARRLYDQHLSWERIADQLLAD